MYGLRWLALRCVTSVSNEMCYVLRISVETGHTIVALGAIFTKAHLYCKQQPRYQTTRLDIHLLQTTLQARLLWKHWYMTVCSRPIRHIDELSWYKGFGYFLCNTG